MMLSTKREDRFPINGTTTKLTLFIKNLIQTIDAKIINKPESIGAEQWEQYKQAGLKDVTDRIAFHKCVLGSDPPSGEPLQTSLKKIIKEMMKKVPHIEQCYHFQNIDNSSRSAGLCATKKIVAEPAEGTVSTPPGSAKVTQQPRAWQQQVTPVKPSEKETGTNREWDIVTDGNRMTTRQSQKEVDGRTNINIYEHLTDNEDSETGLDSDDSTTISEVYNQFDDEKANKKLAAKLEKLTKLEILSTTEYQTIEKVIKKGETNTLDLDVLCKWIMQKNVDILQVCDQLDNKVDKCNKSITTTVKQDHKDLMRASKTAMTTFTNHVHEETLESANKTEKLRIEMEQLEQKTVKSLNAHNKSMEKVKSEMQKAENEGVMTINRTANNKIQDVKSNILKAQELIDKLNGTKSITQDRKKEINNMMTVLSNRLEGLSDKFDETITIISDQEKMRVLEWMAKRTAFMKSNTNDDVIQKMIKLQKEMEESLDAVKEERKLINEERELMEGDRNAFYQWWDSLKRNEVPNSETRRFNFNNTNQPSTNDTQAPQDHQHQENQNQEEYHRDEQGNKLDLQIKTEEPDLVYTFKHVDTHDEQPARSLMHGKVDHTLPQPNQQILRMEHYTCDNFPDHIQPPLKHDTPITYSNNIFKCQGTINYKDNIPTYITDCWYYDIRTTHNVRLTNCAGKFISVNEEDVPSKIYGATSQKVTNPVHNPYAKKAPQQVRNPYRKSTPAHSSNHRQQQPWLNTSKPMGPHEFIYPLGSAPVSVRHHELIKYGNKLNLTIPSKDEFRQFYEDFRNQLKTYNIFIVDYDKVQINQSLAEITPENCENYNVAIKEMSRAIFQFFSFNKDTIFATYTTPIHSLDTYRPSGNGLQFLMNTMKRIHPRLKRHVIELDNGIVSMPCYDEFLTIHKFINALIVYRQDELQNGRRYTDKELLTHIVTTLDERFETAINLIKKELRIAFSNPEHPLPIPSYLKIDSELAIRIIDMLDPDEKIRDLTNSNPRPRRSGATINRMDNRKPNDNQTKRPSDRNNRYQTQNNRRNNNDKWADELKWEIIEGAVCPGCKRSNHNVYKTGCPAFAQFAICQEFYEKCPPKELEKVKSKFTEYQKERRLQMRERKRSGRATIKKFEAKGKYDLEDIAEVKMAFFESYKDDFKEEQYLETNPFDDTTDDETQHEQLETEEIEV